MATATSPRGRLFLDELRGALRPDRHGRHGPLPPMLLALTVVTGLVDAFSYLALDHVFVANMTGNVVFLGFALAGGPGFSIAASSAAIAAFVVGALAGGRLGVTVGGHRGLLLAVAAGIEAGLFAVAALLAWWGGDVAVGGWRYGLILGLGVPMGVQNAVARRLGVPDLTTTVLTLTITGMSADSRIVGGRGSVSGRRSASVVAMLTGATVGGLLVLHVHLVAPLVLALLVALAVAGAAVVARRAGGPWSAPV